MRPVRHHLIHNHGFSLAELLVVIGMIGVLAMAAWPVFANFLQAQQARGAAQELVTLLNQARQLAISTNSMYRVQITAGTGQLCFQQSMNGGATYSACLVGPGTDGAGLRRLENQAILVSATAIPTFNHLGTGSGGTITVQDSGGGSSLGVVVSSAGRIRICPPDCPP